MPWPKETSRRNSISFFNPRSTSYHWGPLQQYLKAWIMEEHWLLPCSWAKFLVYGQLALLYSLWILPHSHNELGLPTSIIKKISHRQCHRQVWRKQFFNISSLLPSASKLCQVDNKKVAKAKLRKLDVQ